MWVGLIILALLSGWSVIRLLPFTWHRLETAAASVAVGFTLAPWAYFAAASLVGWPVGLWLGSGLLALVVAASHWAVRRPRLKFTAWPSFTIRRSVVWLAAVVVAFWLARLMAHSYTFPTSGDWYSNGNVWGDSPLHVSLITQFSHGDKLDLVSPVYKEMPLTYPIMADLWSGVLMRTTPNWTYGLLVPSLIELGALLVLAYYGARRLLDSELAAWLAWYMLVFSGSLQGVIKVVQGLFAPAASYQSIMSSLGTVTGDSYLNFLYSHPLPQRSYLFGMPLLIVAALVALELYRERQATPERRRQLVAAGVIAGVLVGLMPLVHTHSFLVMALLLGLATLLFWLYNRALPPGWLPLVVIGAVLAAPQFIWQFRGSYHSGFSHWILGWVVKGFEPVHANWLWFWLTTIGWLMVMILAGWWLLARAKSTPETWFVYVSGVILFAICNLYVFQPSFWDNMKLFEYAFWLLMLATASLLAAWCRHWWGRIASGAVMVSLCAMGVITLVLSSGFNNYLLLRAAEVSFGEHMRQELPKSAYLLVGDQHNSPITMFSDRKVVMTFSGWYNLYGGDWATTLGDRSRMLQGSPEALDLIHRYHVNFAAFSDAEVASGEVNEDWFASHFKLFDREAGWWVFDLRKAP